MSRVEERRACLGVDGVHGVGADRVPDLLRVVDGYGECRGQAILRSLRSWS